MNPMASTNPRPAYRATPTVSQGPEVAVDVSGSGSLSAEPSGGDQLVHHENLTTSADPSELAARAVAAFAPRRFPKHAFSVVYFARAGGLVKIGVASDLSRRVRALRAGSPVALEIIAYGVGTREREQTIHRHFAASRRHNEWFEPTLELVTVMLWANQRSTAWDRILNQRPRFVTVVDRSIPPALVLRNALRIVEPITPSTSPSEAA